MSSKQDLALAERIGRKMREIRKQKKITLIELSKSTDVAQATLSRMENGQMLGTVESHQKIAEALGTSLSNLYEGIDTRSETVKIQKSSEKRKIVSKTTNVRAELLLPNVSSKKIVPVLVTINPNSKTSMDQADRGIEKFLWVVEGEIKVIFENTEYDLQTNDTLYFDASAPHQFVNQTSKTIKLLSISSQ